MEDTIHNELQNLKAQVYDHSVQIEYHQGQIAQLNQRIAQLNQAQLSQEPLTKKEKPVSE